MKSEMKMPRDQDREVKCQQNSREFLRNETLAGYCHKTPPRCPENTKNTAKHPAWMDIIDIMCFTHSSNHLNTCLALTIHRNLSRGPG